MILNRGSLTPWMWEKRGVGSFIWVFRASSLIFFCLWYFYLLASLCARILDAFWSYVTCSSGYLVLSFAFVLMMYHSGFFGLLGWFCVQYAVFSFVMNEAEDFWNVHNSRTHITTRILSHIWSVCMISICLLKTMWTEEFVGYLCQNMLQYILCCVMT